MSISPAQSEGYLIVALFGLFVLRAGFRLMNGVPARTGRLLVLPGLYIAIFVAELAGVWFAGTGSGIAELTYVALAADIALVGVGILLAYRYTERTVELYRPDGETRWFYRLSPLLPVLYVALFFVRVGIETVILGEAPFSIPTVAQFDTISTVSLYTLFAVDALWGLTTGFLVGRNAAVYRKWQARLESGSSAAPLV